VGYFSNIRCVPLSRPSHAIFSGDDDDAAQLVLPPFARALPIWRRSWRHWWRCSRSRALLLPVLSLRARRRIATGKRTIPHNYRTSSRRFEGRKIQGRNARRNAVGRHRWAEMAVSKLFTIQPDSTRPDPPDAGPSTAQPTVYPDLVVFICVYFVFFS